MNSGCFTVSIFLIFSIISLLVGCDEKVRNSNPVTPVGGVGLRAAEFSLIDIDGEILTLSEYSGSVIILDFWATWCPPCVNEIPVYNDLMATYGNQGLIVIGLSVDTAGKSVVKSFRNNNPMNYRVALADNDTKTFYQSCVPANRRGYIPYTFVIDRQNIIRNVYVGYRNKGVFEGAIAPLL